MPAENTPRSSIPYLFWTLSFPILAAILLLYYYPQNTTTTFNMATNGTKSEILNVLRTPLSIHSTKPMTGFHRDGYCRTSPSDNGHHAVAGILTNEFLDFSAQRGNNLKAAGLEEGCRWCLCTSRWKEAFDAWKKGEVGERAVPKVVLKATEGSVAERVSMEDLKRFEAKE